MTARRVLSFAAAAAAASPLVAGLTWMRHSVPLSGELVLTDVHAAFDAVSGNVTAIATGEGGVVLKLQQAAGTVGGTWITLLDTSFPTYWYGAYVFSPTSYLISGFLDGSGTAYGVIAFSDDGGETWGNDTKIDPCSQAVCAWGGGPIEFANATEGFMPSTSGQSSWRTSSGGRIAAEWTEIVPSAGEWHSGDYIYDGDGLIRIAGSNDCTSTDFGVTWSCGAPVDSSGIDTALACSNATSVALCLVGGGEISPAVAGWTHVSTDGGVTFGAARALNAAYPIRSVQSLETAGGEKTVLLAAGGNFFSAVGGAYSSLDDGATWTQLTPGNGGAPVNISSPWRFLRFANGTAIVAVDCSPGMGSTTGRVFRVTAATSADWAVPSAWQWTDITPNGTNYPGSLDIGFWGLVNVLGDGTLVVASSAFESMYTSQDLGDTWTLRKAAVQPGAGPCWQPNSNVWMQSLTYGRNNIIESSRRPGVWLISTGFGVAASTDRGDTWARSSQGIGQVRRAAGVALRRCILPRLRSLSLTPCARALCCCPLLSPPSGRHVPLPLAPDTRQHHLLRRRRPHGLSDRGRRRLVQGRRRLSRPANLLGDGLWQGRGLARRGGPWP